MVRVWFDSKAKVVEKNLLLIDEFRETFGFFGAVFVLFGIDSDFDMLI